ncbi:S66 family peptidase [Lacticaseibacillus sharpeae]|uniref:Microcin C7 resistance MccF-like protein n=1 Tax=Lacticaseibacillus sharpeae JCM 1186 = DSM 20505 TaxID=1291052 RepID=A0A0R1ZMK6_9LACO|nr:S66 peptidase family protein [Lacticaseibacillus sharpeae]KRM55586.1 microcin C7 resistance MccF-like protein [Lacticaseibacillus sharpeae JCM 1186 = DSM 20505]
MYKPAKLQRGDRVAIVSLSSGALGRTDAQHELVRGAHRLRDLGLTPVFMGSSLRSPEYLAAHPEARAADLKAAFMDPDINGIICAIGGDDTYRLAPFLLDDPEFAAAVWAHPKLFTGFSDTTVNHLMLYGLGLQTFYGPNYINDIAELDTQMLPYTASTIARYFTDQAVTPIQSSPVWYEERTDFSRAALNTPRRQHPEEHGYEVLRGTGTAVGTLLGGCLDSLDDLLTTSRYSDEAAVAAKYHLVPEASSWAGKILFIETSEEQPTPAEYARMLDTLDQHGILAQVSAIIAGKPQNERYYDEYKAALTAATAKYHTPVMFNLNFGHAYPRTALPYGAKAELDLDAKTLTVVEPYFR